MAFGKHERQTDDARFSLMYCGFGIHCHPWIILVGSSADRARNTMGSEAGHSRAAAFAGMPPPVASIIHGLAGRRRALT